MSNKKLTLTIVIPVYNEERYLRACLESITAQAELPDEVIVVDNNSTDKSLEIAKEYSFVKIAHEPRQHQSFAQKTGFDVAKSDILGRIDADSLLPANWVKNIKNYFNHNPGVVGITGGTQPYDMSSPRIGSAGFNFYINLASYIAGVRMLWGANSAIRREAWQAISNRVMTRADIWEDYDTSFCLAPYGRLESIDGIEIDSSFRAVRQSLISQTRYQFRAARTFYFRTSLIRTLVFFFAWLSLFLLFVPVMIDKYLLVPAKEALTYSRKPRPRPSDVVRLEAE